METWQEERIWIWLIAASNNYPDGEMKFFIDLETKALFTERKNHGDFKDNDRFYEFPTIDNSFPMLEDPNAHIFSNKKEDIERMNDSYRRMKYAEKVLKEIGLSFNELKAV